MDKRKYQKLSDKIVIILRKIRIDKGISQYRMSKDTGISTSSISYIENLEQRPALHTLWMIADYLKVDLSDIIKQTRDK